MTHAKTSASVYFTALAVLLCATRVPSQEVSNLTRLPPYPNLIRAQMDRAFTVETLGHQCTRLVASTFDSLGAVEYWYRRTLNTASETDLARDQQFSGHDNFTGIKLALGIDYVAIYQELGKPTTIELHRCNWLTP